MAATGRLWFEMGGNASQLLGELQKVRDAFKETGGGISRGGLQMVAAFKDAVNPTQQLARNFELLEKAGKLTGDQTMSLTNIVRVNESAIRSALETAKKYGQEIPDSFRKYADELKRLDESRTLAGGGMEKLGQAFTNFARNPLQTAQSGLTGLLETMGPLYVAIGGIATAAIAGGAAIVKMGMDAADAAEQIENLSLSTGMTVEDVQALQRLGKETGLGDLTAKIEQLNVQLGKGAGGDFTEAIQRMNISVKEGAGAIYYLEEMRKKYAEIPDQTKRAEQAAADLGRRLYHELAPLVLNTTRSITESMDQIKASGAILTSDQMENMLKLDREIDEHGRAWEWLKNQVKIMTSEATLLFMKMVESMLGMMPAQNEEWTQAAAEGVAQDWMKGQKGKLDFSQYETITAATQDAATVRARAIAQADAIAAGVRSELLDLTIRLRQAEKEYQEEKASAKGLQFDQKHLDNLAAEINSIKEAIDTRQKALAEADKAHQAELKALKESRDLQDLLNDDAYLYGEIFLPAAAEVWEKQIKPAITESLKLQKEFTAQMEQLAAMKPRPLFGEEAGGKTAAETIGDMIKVNEQDRRNREDLSKTPKEVATVWSQQVSTIVTDWSRGISDMIFSGKSFGETLKNMFIDTGKAILRALIETLFNPLKKLLTDFLGSLLGAGKSGSGGGFNLGSLFGSAAGSGSIGGILTALGVGGAAGGAFGGTTGSVIGSLAGVFGAGGMSALGTGALTGGWLGSGIGGFLGGGWQAMLGMFTNPITAIAAGAAILIPLMIKWFSGKSAEQAGSMEVKRDLGGVSISKDVFKQFYQGLGLSEDQAYGIRRDLMMSPAFLTQIAYPAAQAQGRVDALLASLQNVTTVMGNINLADPFKEWMETGSATALNKAYNDLFQNSKALVGVMPDFVSLLDATSTGMTELEEATTSATDGFQLLLDSIEGTIPVADDMYATFMKTGEILPQLADLIAKYGGNLQVFQDYANLGPLRENLSGITSLIEGLDAIMPEEGVIQRILGGKGFGAGGWEELVSMGLDPSKLIKMADLVTFQTGYSQARSQFEQTGKLVKGSLLEQALWQYGGSAGNQALALYGQGFNTITPGLLDTVGTNITTAFQQERTSLLDYLGGVKESINTQIQDSTNAVVTELQNILQAIKDGFSGSTVTPNAATTASGAKGTVTVPGTGTTIIVNGDIYGYEDFEGKVNSAWTNSYRRGGYPQLAPA